MKEVYLNTKITKDFACSLTREDLDDALLFITLIPINEQTEIVIHNKGILWEEDKWRHRKR